MRYITAGESHGESLFGIIEGLPAGLKIDQSFVDEKLRIRQNVYGRGPRAQMILDKAQIKSGLSDGVTTGAPIAVVIDNGNCGKIGQFDFFRPGHADYAAAVKYGYQNAALAAERASARETAMRTALGAICLQFLGQLGICIKANVTEVGGAKCEGEALSNEARQAIDEAAKSGDTLGGKIAIAISGVKAGIGSHVTYDRRLDYIFGGAFMSIPAVKAVENGLGVGYASASGKEVADCFVSENKSIVRTSNNCGGIEGGIANGQDITFTLTFKPIPSVVNISTVDTKGNECLTQKVRGDVTAVTAAPVVAEAVAALELTRAILDCLGGDTMDEVKHRYDLKGRK
ncbi:MAG: chorismate synthase [Clostridia bacterium]|nr:chorismate synthase [Clostridia bacterium]